MPFPALPNETLRGFLAAIRAEPEEDAPRLVFADWLDEHGDPRAEMIRLSVRRDRLPDEGPEKDVLTERLERWEREHRGDWPGGVPRDAVLRRGLFEVPVPAKELADVG